MAAGGPSILMQYQGGCGVLSIKKIITVLMTMEAWTWRGWI